MKNVLKLTALLAALASGGIQAEKEKIKVVFPEFLYEGDGECDDAKWPCQLYAQDPDGVIFMWLKIDPKHPYEILPNDFAVFRGKDYVVTELQEFGQEDIATVASAAECISIRIQPYE